jgi:hypothetical protein
MTTIEEPHLSANEMKPRAVKINDTKVAETDAPLVSR